MLPTNSFVFPNIVISLHFHNQFNDSKQNDEKKRYSFNRVPFLILLFLHEFKNGFCT